MLTARYLNGEYGEEVPDWHASDAPWKAGKLLEMLRRHGFVPSSVCDVGCGAGEVLAQLQARLPGRTRFVGWDVSAQAMALCRTRANESLTFHQGDFATECRERFDLVLLLDVLEHVPDYLGFLSALRDRGERFLFHVPLDLNVEAVARASRPMLSMRERFGHLHYFTAETALAALSDAGYLVEDSFFTWDREGLPPRRRDVGSALKYPLGLAAWGLESAVFRARPQLAALLRPSYNLLVLARPDPTLRF